MDFKNISIGQYIQNRVKELDIPIERICNFFKTDEKNIVNMYSKHSLDTDLLLRWSKLLEYDFFRLYSQHLILYSPSSAHVQSQGKLSKLPQFRKNIYTQGVIEFILGLIESNKKSKSQIIEEYKIPKTTLYKWISKYSKKGK